MEMAPNDVDTIELFNAIEDLKTIQEIHDLHVWSLGGDKHVMTCHVRSNFD